ncbi:MAG: type III pantothenate kinase [Gammaproteobacteria bacterium]
MTLLIDIGNHSIKWALRPAAGAGRFPHVAGDIDAHLARCWSDLPAPQRVLIASVAAPGIELQVSRWMRQRWTVDPISVRPLAQGYGVRNGYTDPAQLGVDRWLALVAVRNRYRGAACIVDCGTAMTVDGLSPEGEHLGGLICPGVEAMRQALAVHTHAVREGAAGAPVLFARTTRDGVDGGCRHALAACADRAAETLARRYPVPRFIITGGAAGQIGPLLEHRFEQVPDLVLSGLAIIGGYDS